ncbi:hypothetical protein BGW80DRAFT_648419 [Lactifluus volemus]|nr:hypothetical protein BGW80DRAFT_648419 [Lactifluus volemus]
MPQRLSLLRYPPIHLQVPDLRLKIVAKQFTLWFFTIALRRLLHSSVERDHVYILLVLLTPVI